MSAPNILAATNLMLALLDRAALLGGLLQTAAAEGRDLTPAELDGVFEHDVVARNELQAAINAAKPPGEG